jgi:hypothetical protein
VEVENPRAYLRVTLARLASRRRRRDRRRNAAQRLVAKPEAMPRANCSMSSDDFHPSKGRSSSCGTSRTFQRQKSARRLDVREAR